MNIERSMEEKMVCEIIEYNYPVNWLPTILLLLGVTLLLFIIAWISNISKCENKIKNGF